MPEIIKDDPTADRELYDGNYPIVQGPSATPEASSPVPISDVSDTGGRPKGE